MTTYCVYSDVNLLTNIVVADIANADVTSIIQYAVYQLNKDISTLVVRERIDYIDNTRENNIDGSNTTFYVRNWEGKFIADMNNDGDVTIADLTVVKVATDGTESSVTVSTIDPENGKFTVSSAPSSDYEMYVTYRWSFANCQSSDSTNFDPLVKMACVLLTAAYCHSKINWGKAKSVAFGNMRFLRHMEAFMEYYKQYQAIVRQINSRMSSGENADGLDEVNRRIK